MRHLLTGAILFTLVNGCIMKSNQSTFETYTLGIWSLKPGHKAEFIRTWTAFAEWNTRHLEGSGKAHLLQDEKDPLRFISFGPWESNDIIQLWRETDEFKDFVVELTALCERFEPNTLRVVSGTP